MGLLRTLFVINYWAGLCSRSLIKLTAFKQTPEHDQTVTTTRPTSSSGHHIHTLTHTYSMYTHAHKSTHARMRK